MKKFLLALILTLGIIGNGFAVTGLALVRSTRNIKHW